MPARSQAVGQQIEKNLILPLKTPSVYELHGHALCLGAIQQCLKDRVGAPGSDRWEQLRSSLCLDSAMLMWTGRSQGAAAAAAQCPEGDEHQGMCLHIHLGLV